MENGRSQWDDQKGKGQEREGAGRKRRGCDEEEGGRGKRKMRGRGQRRTCEPQPMRSMQVTGAGLCLGSLSVKPKALLLSARRQR